MWLQIFSFEIPCSFKGFIVVGKSKSASEHAGSFIYAINLNETGYLVQFFLTEKICLRKGIILGNLILIFFSLTKTRKKPKLEVHCTQQVYWSNSAWFFFSSPLNHRRTISASSNALKPSKSIRQYVKLPPPPPQSE